jgi:hypothetical protein
VGNRAEAASAGDLIDVEDVRVPLSIGGLTLQLRWKKTYYGPCCARSSGNRGAEVQRPDESERSDTAFPVCLVAAETPPRRLLSIYPEPFASMMRGGEKRPPGDAFGLRNFGVNLTRLSPGGLSALRHTHTMQDEFVYILHGTATLVTDAGATLLSPGMCAGFRAGESSGWADCGAAATRRRADLPGACAPDAAQAGGAPAAGQSGCVRHAFGSARVLLHPEAWQPPYSMPSTRCETTSASARPTAGSMIGS